MEAIRRNPAPICIGAGFVFTARLWYDSIDVSFNMQKFSKALLYLLLIFISGAGFFAFHRYKQGGIQNDRGREKFFIDYPKLEELAKRRLDGGRYLAFIRGNEATLYDEDPSNDAESYITMGFNMHALGDDTMAISAYEKGLELAPQHVTGINNIASSYLELGDLAEAERYLRKLTEALPGDSSSYINLAEVYRARNPGDEEGFLEILDEGAAIVVDKHKADLLSYIGTYFRDNGEIARAIGYFEELVKLFPEIEIYKEELGELKEKI